VRPREYTKELIAVRQRKGVALLTVVILAALVLVAIVGMSRGLAAETTITKTDTGFKRALAVAETGLTQVSADLASAVWNAALPGGGSINSPDPYLTLAQVEAIAEAPKDGILTFDWKSYPDGAYPQGSSAFRVKVRKLSEAVWDGVSDFSDQDVVIRLYALGESYFSVAGSTSGLLGRRIVSTEATGRYDLHVGVGGSTKTFVPSTSSPAFNYGLFSGAGITFKGSKNAVVTNGDIYARGDIELAGKQRLSSGHIAYSFGGTVTGAKGDIVRDKGYTGSPPVPDIPFPPLNLGFYYDMANDFKTGSGLYNGSQALDPNTNSPTFTTIIQSYLGAPGVSPTLAGIQSFYNDLQNGSGLWGPILLGQRMALLDRLQYAVYYVVGGGGIAGQFSVKGAVVVSGPGDPHQTDPLAADYPQPTTVHLAGQSSIINPGGLAFFVHGDVKGTGQTYIEGLFYTDGEFDNGSGQCTIVGAVVANNMTHLSGQFNVDYSMIANVPTGGIGGTWTTVETPGIGLYGSVPLVTPTFHAWTEKDLQAFSNAS
jgi:hypothetical protein